ncbi:hypothetical protein HMPREF0868_1470 [Mageeibacillus indolicus UPII9-5]|uniref:Uncharacterized protein n=1 Tax=Mageeibacillus indolicus (strain UPII9-5) TaxID=699246 RepID=D3QZ40_MAGIU|nr:hypothetical protein HMPREF0868_1470 [Mageeibacillus indolicus UPII9-5]
MKNLPLRLQNWWERNLCCLFHVPVGVGATIFLLRLSPHPGLLTLYENDIFDAYYIFKRK